MKQAYIYINYPNIVVLQSYLEVVQKALINVGYQCRFIKSLYGIDKKSLIVYPMGIDAFKYYWKGYKNFILWQQGATADESFMRNHSKLRHWILNKIDVFAMNKSQFVFYVSEYMRKHYEKLAGKSLKHKSYIMPCFNEIYDETIYKDKDYSKNIFTYVGSLALWQCFAQTATLYKQIEERIPNTLFKVLTFSVDEATRIIKEKGIKNYFVACVPKEQVKKELLETTYGFILREDNVVNRVATPTKFSSYLASGVIPLFSDCLNDFYQASKGYKYVKSIPQNYDVQQIIDFIVEVKDPNEIKKEFYSLLTEHYSPSTHINNITKLFAKNL